MLTAVCSCGAKYSLDEKYAGKEAACKKCGQRFRVPTVAAPPPPPPAPPPAAPPSRGLRRSPARSAGGSAKAAPARRGLGSARVGNASLHHGELVVPQGAEVPGHACLVCARRDNVSPVRRDFFYVPTLALLALLLGLLPGVIILVILQRRSRINCPLCPECLSGWKRATLLISLYTWLIGFGLPIGATMYAAANRGEASTLALTLLGSIAVVVVGFIALKQLLIAKKQATVVSIAEGVTRLRLPNAAAVQAAWDEAGQAQAGNEESPAGA